MTGHPWAKGGDRDFEKDNRGKRRGRESRDHG